jgi:hypothetical protein
LGIRIGDPIDGFRAALVAEAFQCAADLDVDDLDRCWDEHRDVSVVPISLPEKTQFY